MRIINRALWHLGVQIVPRMTQKMWREEANVMETSGYPSKDSVVRRFRKSAKWAAR